MEKYFSKLEKLNENNRVLLLTHTDMDGAGAAVLLKSIYRDKVDVLHCSNDVMSRMIRDRATDPDTAKEYDFMIVSDISCSEEDAEYLDKHKQVNLVLLDHHQTAVDLNRFSWACVQPLLLKGSYRDTALYGTGVVPVHSSGTSLVYDYLEYCGLTSKLRNPELAMLFVYMVAAYDTWDWVNVFGGDRHFRDLQTLFMQYGIEEFENVFWKRISDSRRRLNLYSDTDILLLRIAKNKKKYFLKEKVANRIRRGNITLSGRTYSFTYCDVNENMPDVFEYMIKNYDVDLHIVDYGSGLSFRTSRKDINIGHIVKEFGGGGHPGAGGVKIPLEKRKEMLEKVMKADMTFTTKEMHFLGGDGRHFIGGVNYIISDDKTIYSECPVPPGASEEYGYLTMKNAIIREMQARGLSANALEWFYDDDSKLDPDASADCEVFVDIDCD